MADWIVGRLRTTQHRLDRKERQELSALYADMFAAQDIHKMQDSTNATKPRKIHIKHGHCQGGRRSKENAAWSAAKQRCKNPNHPEYHRYGGRGVRMCAEWLCNFAAFFAYMGTCKPGLSLDRINNDGDYEPGNVRWATRKEQNENRKKSNQHIARRERERLAEPTSIAHGHGRESLVKELHQPPMAA